MATEIFAGHATTINNAGILRVSVCLSDGGKLARFFSNVIPTENGRRHANPIIHMISNVMKKDESPSLHQFVVVARVFPHGGPIHLLPHGESREVNDRDCTGAGW